MFSRSKGSKEAPDGAALPPYTSDASSSDPVQDIEPPPSYTGAVAPPQQGTRTHVSPETLILRGNAIYSGSAASAAQLYELSHAMAEVREFHNAVELSRLDYRMHSTAQAGTALPDFVTKKRRIYTLTRPPPITVPPFFYYLEAASGAMGDVALEPYSRFRSSGYRVYKTTKAKGPEEMRAVGIFFVARSRGEGRYDWREGRDDGKVLAYETFGQGFCQLQVVEGMERARRDVLVAAWCLRLWQEVVDGEPRPGCKCASMPKLLLRGEITDNELRLVGRFASSG